MRRRETYALVRRCSTMGDATGDVITSVACSVRVNVLQKDKFCPAVLGHACRVPQELHGAYPTSVYTVIMLHEF